jgi:serine/threonine protein kinase
MVALPSTIGRYEIRSLLGRGMMGVVYEAVDPALTRTVALKTIDPTFAACVQDRRAFERRFETEARIAARLSHPNIVVVHDVGRDEATGTLYIALERLHGETLAALVSRGTRLPWREVLDIGRQVAEALDHLHAQGVVHRDVKPGNIMRLPAVPGTASCQVKLMDFGISKVDSAQLTMTGQVFGTPLYMAPEQASGEAVDGRCDVFSLGSALYTLLTGRPAFAANNVMATLQRIAHEDPPPVRVPESDMPSSVDDVIARCLAKDPSDRYPRARHLAEDLTDILEDRPPRHRKGWKRPLARVATSLAGSLESLVELASPTRTVNVLEGLAPATVRAAPNTRPRRGGLYVDLVVAGSVLAAALGLLFWPGAFGDRIARAEGAPVAFPSPGTAAPPRATSPAVIPTAPAPATPAPTAPPTPAPVVAPARIVVDVQHPLRRGVLSIFVDEKRVLRRVIRGDLDKKLLLFKTHSGVHTDLLSIAPGRHQFEVEAAWDGDTRRERIGARFLPGETYRLEVRLGRLKKDMSLKWTR